MQLINNSVRRTAWVTNAHLNFVWDKDRGVFEPEYEEFVHTILASDVDQVLAGWRHCRSS